MTFPVHGAYGAGYSSSVGGGAHFIPEIWSGKLLVKFYPATVFGSIANTDYEGEISSMGDKVIIRTTPSITIRDYEIGATLTTEKPQSVPIELLIDKGKYFSFKCDDIDKYQADIKLLDDWSTDASEQMKIAVDTGVLTAIWNLSTANNKGAAAGQISGDIPLGTAGAPRALTAANAMDAIVDLGTVLDEQNIPETGRWLVMPAKAAGLIKKSELRDASLTGDGTSVLRNGRIGMVDRFEIYISNNLPRNVSAGTNSVMLAGHPSALTFASQMTNMETLRAESTFGDIVRGLNVYGFNVLKPEAMATLLYDI